MSSLTAATPTTQTSRRPVRTVVLFVLFILLAGALLALLTTGEASQRTALDPANPEPEGAQALARVLEDQGVEVIVVRSAAALESQQIDPGTSVLVTSADALGNSTAERLLTHSRLGTLIVVEPSPGVATALGLDAQPYGVSIDEPRVGDCVDSRFNDLVLEADGGSEYDLRDGCFGGENGVLIGMSSNGTTVLGVGQILANAEVLRSDNAAISLILLGENERLVWYVPTLADLSGDDGVSLSALLPDWLRPAVWCGGVATLALILWRGRRLGPLVSEPTPVEVKAIETTLSRGRLYRKANDRAHAAAALRMAARERLRLRLHLPTRTTPDVLTRQLSVRLRQPSDVIGDAIDPDAPSPTTDQQLISLANRLAELDEEVRRS